MSRSAEDILLQVKYVKHKKNEGTLYLMGERLAWMASHKSDTFAINHKYMDIKSQKISPEGKPKIQLQIGK
jgi:transcription initiation factor TFIIH subunit 1